MAQLVLGIGTSHTPMLNAPPTDWPRFYERDSKRTNLLDTEGRLTSYDEQLKHAPAGIAQLVQWTVAFLAPTAASNVIKGIETLEISNSYLDRGWSRFRVDGISGHDEGAVTQLFLGIGGSFLVVTERDDARPRLDKSFGGGEANSQGTNAIF